MSGSKYAADFPEHYYRFVQAGFLPEHFDLLLTSAPDIEEVNSSQKVVEGYMSSTITSNDPVFLWGFANRLRDKYLLPNVFCCCGDDFSKVRATMAALLEAHAQWSNPRYSV